MLPATTPSGQLVGFVRAGFNYPHNGNTDIILGRSSQRSSLGSPGGGRQGGEGNRMPIEVRSLAEWEAAGIAGMLSVVIPAHNEEGHIADTVHNLATALRKAG